MYVCIKCDGYLVAYLLLADVYSCVSIDRMVC